MKLDWNSACESSSAKPEAIKRRRATSCRPRGARSSVDAAALSRALPWWEREPDESAKDFERRFSEDAERITNRGTVVLLPFNGRGL